MHYANLDMNNAISAAKAIRPIIDPISHLGILLQKFGAARERRSLKMMGRNCRKSFNSIVETTVSGAAASLSLMGFTKDKSIKGKVFGAKRRNSDAELRCTSVSFALEFPPISSPPSQQQRRPTFSGSYGNSNAESDTVSFRPRVNTLS